MNIIGHCVRRHQANTGPNKMRNPCPLLYCQKISNAILFLCCPKIILGVLCDSHWDQVGSGIQRHFWELMSDVKGFPQGPTRGGQRPAAYLPIVYFKKIDGEIFRLFNHLFYHQLISTDIANHCAIVWVKEVGGNCKPYWVWVFRRKRCCRSDGRQIARFFDAHECLGISNLPQIRNNIYPQHPALSEMTDNLCNPSQLGSFGGKIGTHAFGTIGTHMCV